MSYNPNIINRLNVMHWNSQGITNRNSVIELEHFLHQKQIHIALINETFLKEHHKFKITNYKIYRADRPTHGGGVLIAIKNKIPHQILPHIPTYELENISILINIDHRPIRLIAAYSPKYTANFAHDIDKMTSISEDYLIFGDLNAHHKSWNCFHNNSAGNCLFNNQLQSNFYIYAPTEFTRYPQGTLAKRPSVVDILLTNSSINISPLETHPGELQSDHVPITCQIYGQVSERRILVPQLKLADWNAIQNWAENKIQSLSIEPLNISLTNIEITLSRITKIVQGAAEKVPKVEKQAWQQRLSRLTIYLIGQRRRYTRKLQRSNNVQERIYLTCVLKQLSKLISWHTCQDRNNSWNNFLQGLPPGRKKFWAITKAIKGKKCSVGNLKSNGTDVLCNTDKANLIADSFENAHKTTLSSHSSVEGKVEKHIQWLNSQRIPNTANEALTTSNEIKLIVSQLKNNKAAGVDGIKAIFLKKMPEIFFHKLAIIFNWCILNGYFPMQFKKAKIVPVLKAGKDAKQAASYRPISILCGLDKVFENVIHSRIVEYSENNRIINKEQFGFRRDHSTIHQLKRVLNYIKTNKENRKSTGVVFLDIEKAFDSIWHNGLIFKMNQFGYPIYLQKMIQSFLLGRSFIVTVGEGISTERSIPAGVPQGSILSPHLYSIFTADFSIPRNQKAAFYADDSALITSGKVSNALVKNMKKAITVSQKYFDRWKIKINSAKTKAIIFPYNKSPKRIPSIQLSVNNEIIPLEDSVKYLGVLFDKKLNFNAHISYISGKAIKCGRALFPLLNRKSKLNVKNKTLIYKMCIRPIITYGCPIWSTQMTQTNLKKLQVIQNKNLKCILNLPRRFPTNTLHSRFNFKLLSEIFNEISQRFEDRCRSSHIHLIRHLYG